MFGHFQMILKSLLGIKITRISSENEARLADLSQNIKSTIERSQPYTMTTSERLAAVCMSLEYVVANEIPGAFVECGVWRGGSSMAAALTCLQLGRRDMDLFLFDTFEGMSSPGEEDIHSSTGQLAAQLLASRDKKAEIWAYAPMSDVRENLRSTDYPESHLHLIKGKVEDTIPENAPDQISVLRLDTDWYESTRHELIHLFPKLSKNGILIIDDYGAWAGARKAVDEYFSEQKLKPFLARIDNTGRIYVKV